MSGLSIHAENTLCKDHDCCTSDPAPVIHNNNSGYAEERFAKNILSNTHKALANAGAFYARFMPVSSPPLIDFFSLLCYNSGVEET